MSSQYAHVLYCAEFLWTTEKDNEQLDADRFVFSNFFYINITFEPHHIFILTFYLQASNERTLEYKLKYMLHVQCMYIFL